MHKHAQVPLGALGLLAAPAAARAKLACRLMQQRRVPLDGTVCFILLRLCYNRLREEWYPGGYPPTADAVKPLVSGDISPADRRLLQVSLYTDPPALVVLSPVFLQSPRTFSLAHNASAGFQRKLASHGCDLGCFQAMSGRASSAAVSRLAAHCQSRVTHNRCRQRPARWVIC